MSDGVDASQQMIDGWARQLQETAARYQAMADRMQDQTVTERTKDGTVEVTVDAKGLLKNLVISESASGKRMAEVSAEVMRLVQKAQSRIPELLQQAATETLGRDGTGNQLVAEAKSTFPEPPEEPSGPPEPDRLHHFGPEETEAPPATPPAAPPRPQAPPPPPPRRRRPESQDDDDDFGGSILS